MGVRLYNLCFAGDRGRDEDGVQFRGHVIDSEQLGALKEKFGLSEDGENPDGQDTSQPGVAQACDVCDVSCPAFQKQRRGGPLMDATAILNRLYALAVNVRAEGGNVVDSAGSKAPPELKDGIREKKVEFLAVLVNPPSVDASLDRLCKGQIWLTDHHALWVVDGTNAASEAEFPRM